MQKRRWILAGIVALMVGVMPVLQAQGDEVIDLVFHSFITEGAAEQDLFVLNDDGMAVRITPDSPISMLSLPTYSLANVDDFVFDPFQLEEGSLGPWEAGDTMGVTMLEWLSARGSGTYTVSGDTASVDLSFVGLMPDGLYTLWCSRLSLPPNFAIENRPCGAADGSENTFTTDERGDLHIQMSFPALLPSNDTEVSVLGMAWHADGKTYGSDPGPFGKGTYTQLHAVVAPAS
jgi:hypothetical protein